MTADAVSGTPANASGEGGNQSVGQAKARQGCPRTLDFADVIAASKPLTADDFDRLIDEAS